MPEGVFNRELDFLHGRGPLSFCIVSGINGFSDSVYFGEYFANHAMKPVSIYGRDQSGVWHILYKFECSEINHIHAIIPDIHNQCVWVLTGDFLNGSGIWMATDNFRSVLPVARGSQAYRSCVGFTTELGLVYATDTPFEQNSIRIFSLHDGIASSKIIGYLNGPCVYGCELKNYYVFTTVTEPDPKTAHGIMGLFDNRCAPGIKKNVQDVVLVRKSDYSIKVLLSLKKDIYPYRIFQFGAIMLPVSCKDQNILYFQPVGSKISDLQLMSLDLDVISGSTWDELDSTSANPH